MLISSLSRMLKNLYYLKCFPNVGAHVMTSVLKKPKYNSQLFVSNDSFSRTTGVHDSRSHRIGRFCLEVGPSTSSHLHT